MDNKAFTYHLQLLLKDGLIAKAPATGYSLTTKGRKLGVSVGESLDDIMGRAYSLLFLVVRRESDGAWLLYRRKNHPLRGRVGFMHTRPLAEEPVGETARRVLYERTGLSGTFLYVYSGYSRVFIGTEPESFIHFSLLTCSNAVGELTPNDPYADYFWELTPDFTAADMLPNMTDLVAHCQQQTSPLFEHTYQLDEV